MPKYEITWNESGASEEVESDIANAQEYKTARFGTPASEVTVKLVKAASAKKTAFTPIPEPTVVTEDAPVQ